MAADLECDVVIVGGGPAGATAALRLLEMGLRPVIVEKVPFPRFHIGESMTGECGALVRAMGFGDQMEAADHPVKHGVVVFGSRGNSDWWLPTMRRTEAGDLEAVTTWQVRRSTFDAMMLDAALARGAELVEGRATDPISDDDGTEVAGVEVRTADGATVRVRAPLTFDCSGQATFLANRKATGPKYLGAYDKQIAIFAQVANYERDDDSDSEHMSGNTHIFYTEKFRWGWAIPIDDVVTSVGVVCPAQELRSSGLSKGEFLRDRLMTLNPGLAGRVGEPEIVDDTHVIPNYSFQVRQFAGPGYLCVGDSHRFVDPIFSFGVFIAMREAHMAADAAVGYLAGEGRGTANPFGQYMVDAERAIDKLEDMVDTFWENPLAFGVLVHRRYREPMIDLFAGRVYEGMGAVGLDEALGAFRTLLGRERTYDAEGLYSVPIGSRYHPERAPLWNSHLDSVETTEEWMRELA